MGLKSAGTFRTSKKRTKKKKDVRDEITALEPWPRGIGANKVIPGTIPLADLKPHDTTRYHTLKEVRGIKSPILGSKRDYCEETLISAFKSPD